METTSRRPGFLKKYAEHAGISSRAAAAQLKRVGIDYMQPFDFAEADRNRQAMRHASRLRFAKPIPGNEDSDLHTSALPADAGCDNPAMSSFAEAQALERNYKAKLAELEYRERIGELVEKRHVEAEAFRIGRLVRDGLLNIPARLAGILAAESDQRKVHDLMEHEIRQALEALSADAN